MVAPADVKKWITHMQPPAVERMLKEAATENVISFAGGLPAETLFPTEDLNEALQKVIAEHASEALQYYWAEGYAPLREQIAQRMSARGMPTKPTEVLVTHGAQQALDLIAKLLIRAGDTVVLESPTYVPAIQAFEMHRPAFEPLTRNEHGIDLQQLRDVLSRSRPRLLYVVPTGHNPTGVSLTYPQRRELLELLQQSDAYVVEDDAYGELQYGARQTPLRALAPEFRQHFFVGSFSKILSPGLRVGWIAAPEALIKELILIKQASDLQTSTLTQLVLSNYMSSTSLNRHVERCIDYYRERRDCVLASCERHLPPSLRWTRPDSGFSVWMELAADISAGSLLKKALNNGVAFEPGEPFFVSQRPLNYVRVSFSNLECEQIEDGIQRLAGLLSAS